MCLKPSLLASAIWEVDVEALVSRGIRGVILDLDNTIVYWRKEEVLPEAQAWIEAGRQRGLQFCLASNALLGRRAARVAHKLGIPQVGRATKPFASAYHRAMRMMGTSSKTTCAIGDQIFTDVLGANRLGLTSVLVEPLSARESPHTRLVRLVERPLRRRWAQATSSPQQGPGSTLGQPGRP